MELAAGEQLNHLNDALPQLAQCTTRLEARSGVRVWSHERSWPAMLRSAGSTRTSAAQHCATPHSNDGGSACLSQRESDRFVEAERDVLRHRETFENRLIAAALVRDHPEFVALLGVLCRKPEVGGDGVVTA
jgi:hypothetical protein